MIKRVFAVLALLALAPAPALAQNEFPTPTAGKTAVGVVAMCLNAQGKAVPTDQSGACPGGGSGGGAVTATLGAYVDGAITTLGLEADAAWVSGSGTIVAVEKAVVGALATTNVNLGPPGAAACATDTGSCSLNALLQRIAQRLTTINTTPPATPAGANNIGNVGSPMNTVCLNPTVTNGTYGANVVLGGLLTFSNLQGNKHGHIQTVSLGFTTVQTVGFKLYPLRASPSTTYTDHSAAAISGYTDISNVDQPIQLSNPDSGLGTMTNYGAIGLGQAYNPQNTSGFFVLVPTATTASLGGTTSVLSVCVTSDYDP